MKKIKSYTGIWNVEKVLYAINDFNLPFPVTFTQITDKRGRTDNNGQGNLYRESPCGR